MNRRDHRHKSEAQGFASVRRRSWCACEPPGEASKAASRTRRFQEHVRCAPQHIIPGVLGVPTTFRCASGLPLTYAKGSASKQVRLAESTSVATRACTLTTTRDMHMLGHTCQANEMISHVAGQAQRSQSYFICPHGSPR